MAGSRSTRAIPSKQAERVIDRLGRFHVEIPSWGFANTGTRFGKFLQDAAAVDLEDKLADAGCVHAHTGATPAVAVHVLWDFPDGYDPAVAEMAERFGVRIGSINPNVFEDQDYKFGSITNDDARIRRKAVSHILDCVDIGKQTDSSVLSLWFADGANYPGQGDIRQRKSRATLALKKIHNALPRGMEMLLEYKPFEPATYFTDFFDWGSSYIFAKAAGPRAKVLVDTGHHLPGTNIEQIVAWLIDEKMLGGFHFNDRKYADDDLTVGSIDPYQAFRIFNEIAAWEHQKGRDLEIAWMIDQSHAVKPKVEAMIQTVCTCQELLAKALLVDRDALAAAREAQDIVAAEETLRQAFFTDVDDLLRTVRQNAGAPEDPLGAYRESGYAENAAEQRRQKREDLGADAGGGYA